MNIENCKACGATINIIHEANECPYCGTHNSLYTSKEIHNTVPVKEKTSKLKVFLFALALLIPLVVISSIYLEFPFIQQESSNSVYTKPLIYASSTPVQSENENVITEESDDEKSYIVTVVSKLKARSEPNLTAPTIEVVYENRRLEIIDTQDKFETIDNIESKWIKVKLPDGEEGWIFGGYTMNFEYDKPPYSVKTFIGTWKCQSNCSKNMNDSSNNECIVAFTFNHNRSIQIPANFCSDVSADITTIKSTIGNNSKWLYNNYDNSYKIINQKGEILSGFIEKSVSQRFLRIHQAISTKFINSAD